MKKTNEKKDQLQKRTSINKINEKFHFFCESSDINEKKILVNRENSSNLDP